MAIRVSLGHVDEYDDDVATFAHQLGLGSVQLHNPGNLPEVDGVWTVPHLQALVDRCTADGLRIEGLENVPASMFWKIQRGLVGRDEQLEKYQATIRNMAAVGLDLLGYNFLVTYVWRTDMRATGRGGAVATAFDLDRALTHGNELATYKLTPHQPLAEPMTTQQLWANYQYFLDAVLPVAEEVGVRLALHPDDPPVNEPLGGAARIFTSPAAIGEGYSRAGGSPAWGLNFCIGTVSEMGGQAAVEEVIDLLAPDGRIFYCHFRDVIGTVPRFTETFLGGGNLDPAAVVQRLHDRGFDGFMIDDHVPAMIGDADTWGDTSSRAYISRGRAHAIGYLQGVLNGLRLGER